MQLLEILHIFCANGDHTKRRPKYIKMLKCDLFLQTLRYFANINVMPDFANMSIISDVYFFLSKTKILCNFKCNVKYLINFQECAH